MLNNKHNPPQTIATVMLKVQHAAIAYSGTFLRHNLPTLSVPAMGS